MKCKNHPEEIAVNTCNECGCWMCERCTFERSGRLFCPACAAQNGEASAERGYTRSYSHLPRRQISWGLLFLFSVIIPIPGLNYMYLGLIKRGLITMSAFFGAIYLTAVFNAGWVMLFVAAFMFACIFDGFKLRIRINAGEEVSDNIDDITAFIRQNRVVITGILLILVAVNVIGGILPVLMNILRRVLPILIAVWAIHALFIKKPRKD